MNPDLPAGALQKPPRGAALLERDAVRAERKKLKARLKRRKVRAEKPVVQRVRAECVERDGDCLVLTRIGIVDECEGESQWAHFSGHRRSQTRKMAPEKRHDSRWTGMLCTFHHGQEESGEMEIVYRTSEYANGPIGWAPRQQKAA